MIGDNSKVIMFFFWGGVKSQTVTSSCPRCWSCWDFTTPVRRMGEYYDR